MPQLRRYGFWEHSVNQSMTRLFRLLLPFLHERVQNQLYQLCGHSGLEEGWLLRPLDQVFCLLYQPGILDLLKKEILYHSTPYLGLFEKSERACRKLLLMSLLLYLFTVFSKIASKKRVVIFARTDGLPGFHPRHWNRGSPLKSYGSLRHPS